MTDDPHARREAVIALAAAVRALGDAVVETDIDPAYIGEVTAAVDALTERLAARKNLDPYFSGLAGADIDRTKPEQLMPINPIVGRCSPTRPDVHIWLADGVAVGTARLSKRFTGPPGCCHGGISAMLADQLVALAPVAAGRGAITKELHVRYRRALPLDTDLRLRGVCLPAGAGDGDSVVRAAAEVWVGDTLAVEASAELAPYQRLVERNPRRG